MSDLLTPKIDAILNSYTELGGINFSDGEFLPSRKSIQSILNNLEEILFPGYFDPTPVNRQNLKYSIGQKIVTTMEALCTEIAKSLAWAAIESGSFHDTNECKYRATTITHSLLDEIPTIRKTLMTDVLATYNGDPAAKSEAEIILAYPGFQATRTYRIAHFLFGRQVPLIPRMMTEIVHSQTGIDIHPGATIGPSFCIDHGTGIVIGETADIGTNVKLYQGVTLGALSVPKTKSTTKRHPTLRDNIVVYAETTILGGDTIVGSNSIIGGNVWITQSIPENSKIYLSADYQQLIKAGTNKQP